MRKTNDIINPFYLSYYKKIVNIEKIWDIDPFLDFIKKCLAVLFILL